MDENDMRHAERLAKQLADAQAAREEAERRRREREKEEE